MTAISLECREGEKISVAAALVARHGLVRLAEQQ
jgi:hypothetical protein